jgi:hypothetical protein
MVVTLFGSLVDLDGGDGDWGQMRIRAVWHQRSISPGTGKGIGRVKARYRLGKRTPAPGRGSSG